MPRPAAADGIEAEFGRRLPFTLTDGQRRVGEVISRDLSCAFPMHRLLQGEVGSGKTVVAVRAMLQAVDAGGQAALLAPTEVLAQQHYRSITALLGPLAAGGRLDAAEKATTVALLTGSVSAAGRRQALSDAATGRAGMRALRASAAMKPALPPPRTMTLLTFRNIAVAPRRRASM